MGHPLIHVSLAAGEAKAALTAEGYPLFFQAVRAQLGRIARLQGATAEHGVDDGPHMTILVPRMALLEGPPVIADDLLEGVFIDPLPCGCHIPWHLHVFTPRSTWVVTLLRPSLPIVFPFRDGQKGGFSKRKFLYARVTGEGGTAKSGRPGFEGRCGGLRYPGPRG